MELKTDKSHKKIDLRHLNLSEAKRIAADVGITSLILIILSGCSKKEDYTYQENKETTAQEQTVEQVPSEEINIEDMTTEAKIEIDRNYNIVEHSDDELVDFDFSNMILNDRYGKLDDGTNIIEAENITYGDLKKVKTLSMTVKDGVSYDILNYMPNLEELRIFDRSGDKVNFSNIDGSRLPGNLKVQIVGSLNDTSEFTRERYGFLMDVPSIENLDIDLENYDSEFIQGLKQVKNLRIAINDHSNFRCANLSHLSTLTISGEVYNIPICISSVDINRIKSDGVKVSVVDDSDNDISKEVEEVDNKLNEIIDSLNIDDSMSEQDKLNAILTYVLCNYSYDKEVSNIIYSGEEVPDEMHDQFYDKGSLTGIFENDTQICGNYAAITSALCKRVGLDAFSLISSNHGWNAVKVGDYYYYVDSTWLDSERSSTMVITDYTEINGELLPTSMESRVFTSEEAFSEMDYEKIGALSWYLVDPTELDELGVDPSQNESHRLVFVPYGLELKDIPEEIEEEMQYKNISTEEETTEATTTEETTEEKVEDISNKKFIVKFNGKTIIIGASAFIGILSALGMGKLIKKKKEKDRKRRLREFDNIFDDDFSSSSSNPWDEDSFDSKSRKGNYRKHTSNRGFDDMFDDDFLSSSSDSLGDKSNKGHYRRHTSKKDFDDMFDDDFLSSSSNPWDEDDSLDNKSKKGHYRGYH